MNIDVLTLSPEMFDSFTNNGTVYRAINKNYLNIRLFNIRDYSSDKHKQVDDYAFGGGPGMIMKPEPLYTALQEVMKLGSPNPPIVYFTPQGRILNQNIVNRYKEKDRIIILCAQYKEIDQRIRDMFVTDEMSIGDYVLSCGEIPAMVFIDSVSRLIDGVLGNIESALSDSHQNNLLGTPHYTRPSEFMGQSVPEVLMSGNHKAIDEWRQAEAANLTKQRRPDLFYGKK